MKRNQNPDRNHSQKVPAVTTWTPTGWKPDLRMKPSFPSTASP
jgi:hypothetical protein